MRFKMTQEDIDKAWNLVLKKGRDAVDCSNCPVSNTLLRAGFENVFVNGIGMIHADRFAVKQSDKLALWISEFDIARTNYKKNPVCPMTPIVFVLDIPKELLQK